MIGVTQSPNVTLASNGQGSHGGMGTGQNGGLGSGNGNGYGPGTGGNVGGGLYHVGNGVSEPKLTYSVEAEFSDEARRAKYEGTVVISLIVDAQGNPQNIRARSRSSAAWAWTKKLSKRCGSINSSRRFRRHQASQCRCRSASKSASGCIRPEAASPSQFASPGS